MDSPKDWLVDALTYPFRSSWITIVALSIIFILPMISGWVVIATVPCAFYYFRDIVQSTCIGKDEMPEWHIPDRADCWSALITACLMEAALLGVVPVLMSYHIIPKYIGIPLESFFIFLAPMMLFRFYYAEQVESMNPWDAFKEIIHSWKMYGLMWVVLSTIAFFLLVIIIFLEICDEWSNMGVFLEWIVAIPCIFICSFLINYGMCFMLRYLALWFRDSEEEEV